MISFLSYRKSLPNFIWPKSPPILTQAQQKAREDYMLLWHQKFLKKYRAIENFNHGYVSKLPLKKGTKTLEIGAGIGTHLNYEDLKNKEYYALEYREEFCHEIRKIIPSSHVFCGNIHHPQPWENKTFDRIVAIHVLEHLQDLPRALNEIHRLLKKGGFLDIVIPCEGGLAHSFARKISAERIFKKTFKMDFLPIHLNEHVNSFIEILELLKQRFLCVDQCYFPFRVPFPNLNFCVGFRWMKEV